MRVIKSKRADVTVTVPVRGGWRVQFTGHQAVMPDEVAAVLTGMGPHFYTDLGDVGEIVGSAKVLIIRDKGLGDVLMLTPLIQRLAIDKAATVDVLTHERYRCLFENNRYVHQTFALEEDRGDRAGYDVVIDLRLVVENSERLGVWEHRADAFAAYADIQITPEQRKPDYFLSPEEVKIASHYRRVFLEGGRRGVIGYVWRSSTGNRNWAVTTHAAVIGALEAAGYGILILDHDWLAQELAAALPRKEKAEDSHVIDLSGYLSLREVAAVMSQCDAIVTPDTGLFHLAAALDVPTLTYFGAFPVAERQAHRSLAVINDAATSCSLAPCRSYHCLNRDADGQARCLAVDATTVISRLEEMLHECRNRVGGSSPDGDTETANRHDDSARECNPELGCLPVAVDPGDDSAAGRTDGLPAGGDGSEGDAQDVLQPEGWPISGRPGGGRAGGR